MDISKMIKEINKLHGSSKKGNEAVENAIMAIIQWNQYLQIGTIVQCKEAREKQIAKTPDYEGDGYSEGKLILDTWICPNCGRHYEVGYHDYEYCPHCGQHILHADWEK